MKGWTSIYSNRPNPSLVPQRPEPPAALRASTESTSDSASVPGRRRDVSGDAQSTT